MNKITGRKISCITVVYGSLVAVFAMITALSCTTQKEIMTEPLFRQTKRANLGLPQDGVVRDSLTGQLMIVENVTYENAENSYVDFSSNESTPQVGDNFDLTAGVQKLKPIEVKGRSRFTPERDGRIAVDFMVEVPKELLSDKWRLTLKPTLLHNDSIIELQKIILRGSKFAEKQKRDYATYRKFLESLVLKSGYDDVFLDKKSIRKDVHRRQVHYWNKYNNEWKKQVAYENWRFEREDQDAFYEAKAVAYKQNTYAQYALQTLKDGNRENFYGEDTVKLDEQRQKKYEKKVKGFPDHYEIKEMTKQEFPRKYRENFEKNISYRDITNEVLKAEDSLNISAYRYFFDKIAINEALIAQKNEYFDNIVLFPYSDPSKVRIDSVIENKHDFTYFFSQDYPVAEGLKNIRITLRGNIEAMDRSTYTLQDADTLSYVISSLVQLIDTTLSVKEITIYRDAVKKITLYPKFPAGDYKYNINYMDNRVGMKQVLASYMEALTDNRYVLDSVIVTSSSSIDGTRGNNEKASGFRLDGVYNYIVEQLPEGVDLGNIKPRNLGEDWNALIELTKKRTDLTNKEALIAKMSDNSIDPDKREAELKFLYRSDYKILQDNVFPLMRKVDVIYYLRRPNMDKPEMIQEEVLSGYKEGIRLLENREYTKALTYLSNFSDYNTALCYACMGYNGTAYQMLLKLDPDKANTQYLLALVCCRLKKEDAAILHLVKSCELDRTKVFRARLDAETKQLIQKYNLDSQLQDIADKAYEQELDKELEDDGLEKGNNENSNDDSQSSAE